MDNSVSDASVILRDVEPDDWPAIATLIGRRPEEGAGLRRQVQAGYDPWFALVAVEAGGAIEAGETNITGNARRARGEIVGAVVAGVPRGRSEGGSEEARAGTILWVEVAARWRRRGVGTRLLTDAFDELRDRGVRQVVALVDGTQFEALALFRKLGFETEGETLSLVLPPARAAQVATTAPAAPAATSGPVPAVVRPLRMDEVSELAGLLVELGVVRAQAPHDELPALTPVQVVEWLQRPGTVAFAAWEAGATGTPVGLAWATRRRDDAELRFVGVSDDARRRGIGTALLGALVDALARPASVGGGPGTLRAAGATGDRGVAAATDLDAGAGPTAHFRPLRARLVEPSDEQEFFRALGFEAERVTRRLVKTLGEEGRRDNGNERAVD
ncbi:MAG: GNAT family N-acetyltransferase [Chloroflexi bacterium]|nr:GNAT family N-acetyltransferase [Chloroflexota bacterium]